MKVILVYVGDILHCPPAMTVIQTLSDININVIACVNRFDHLKTDTTFLNRKNVQFEYIGDVYNPHKSLGKKALEIPKLKRNIWKCINKYYKSDEDIIWIVDGGNVKYLGKRLLKTRYILHLLELTEELYYIESRHLLPVSRDYAKNAACIVECEFARAHITKAWWDLDSVPMVLPNKPYYTSKMGKFEKITNDDTLSAVLKKLKDKKIIIYQGNISKERPLEPFIQAVEELGDPFVLLALVNGKDPVEGKNYRNYYYVPFVAPPFHLKVTSYAYIGILTYVPVKNDYSILNTLFCAPNKIWEYSMFSLPMIGNDLPSLRYTFDTKGIGECFEHFDKEEIKRCIKKIDMNYSTYSEAASRYFDSISIPDLIIRILNKASNQRENAIYEK